MKVLKTALLVLLAAALLLCSVGCHQSLARDVFDVPDGLDENKTYEIVFWAKNDTNVAQKEVYEQAIEDFCAAYPNVKVKLRFYTDYGKIYNDVITNISTGTTPDVCITYPDHIATYITGDNVVVPLDALIADERYGLGGSEVRFDSTPADRVTEKYLDECRIGGVCYALPFMRSTEACYVNKTLVEKLGYELPEVLTWDFVWEVSEAALKKDADGNFTLNGQKTMIPFIYKSTDNMMIQMLRQSGGGYSNDRGDVLLFNDTTEEILRTVAEHAAAGAFSTFKISSYPGNFLNAGQCLFAVDSTAGSTWMGANSPNSDISPDKRVDYELAVLPVPQFDPDSPAMISQGPSVCVFNKDDPERVLASWLFAQFLLTDGVQTAYARTEGYVPVTDKARESGEYLDYLSREEESGVQYFAKIRASRLMTENVENTFITPVFNGSASLRDAAGQLIENVTKSVRRKETVDDAYFKKLYSDVRSLYRLDSISAGGAVDTSADLGPLPGASVALICGVAGAWVLIGVYVAVTRIAGKTAKKRKNT